MKQDVRLYIDNRLVEFTKPFEILYNFKTTDITHPTSIKNSYTKNIVLDDTQINNEIFGNIWNVEKVIGTGFNPNKKAPFTIYVNSELYEKGYVKLNSITKVKNRYKYDITLFGGLGQMFYALSNKDDNNKKTLADLIYTDKSNNELDLSFTINKDTIFDAWNTLIGNTNGYIDETNVNRPESYYYNEKWNTINFIPAYEGKPTDNFAPDTVLINSKDLDITTSQNGYKTINGYALGTATEDLTMNETGDFRSYLQRPVIKMKSIINACQNPKNNGGWELKLDEFFFNDKNPYYNDCWMTLNRLIDNEKEESEVEEIDDVTMVKNGNEYNILFGENIDLSNYINAEIDIEVLFNLTSTDNANYPTVNNKLYTTFEYNFNKTRNNKKAQYRKYNYNGALCIQLVAFDENNNVVTASDTHYLSSLGSGSLSSIFEKGRYQWEKTGLPTNNIIYHNGYFKKPNSNVSNFVWYDDNGDNAFRFKLSNNIKFYTLKMRTMWIDEISYEKKTNLVGYETVTNGKTNGQMMLWVNNKYTNETNVDNELQAIYKFGGRCLGTNELSLLLGYASREIYNNFFSNKYITPQDYLTTDKTPADYLIGYAKMFGLYFWTNPKEIPSNKELYPNGVMHLLTRDSFYRLTEVTDLTTVLDRGREFEITPYVLDKKYYSMEIPQADSQVAEEYNKKYGSVYGTKIYETQYQFNEKTENLLDGTPFKSAVDVLEVDKYFVQRDEKGYPYYYYNGFTYDLFKQENDDLSSETITVPTEKKVTNNINDKDIKNGDSFSKVQLHINNNDPISDGSNILVFFNGSSLIDEVNNSYYITDDLPEMYSLNNEIPCYILTNSEVNINNEYIAYKMNEIPKFQRNKVKPNGNIEYSLDMGNSKVNYNKNYNTTNMSISSNIWNKYINDLKDENNRVMKCYLNFLEIPNAYLLRNLYWYENNYWILNEAVNWNINLIEPVECELIKVIDRYNYETNEIKYEPNIIFKLEGMNPTKIVENKEMNQTHYYYNISKDLLKLNVIIYSENNSFEWWFNDYFYRRDFETGRTEEEPFTYYTTAQQYNVGSMRPDIRLPYSDYKQIYDFTINTDTRQYLVHLETNGIIPN